ncbi:divalent-cation tolerance protein CutA [Novosphingobium sp. ERN07]|uniref:divalent-cation tolerance protein CutA n=1 Tax=Novosphingobium sp. ERN07 TaxID=2726187 RepID=UPI00145678E9|nr:divalent-cation tolerance protein CutA [Novosphingobium sp. ERN07]NLR69475.1 divalent-cation tolerance protein CutA [Novosphingobium sp. ERN07]
MTAALIWCPFGDMETAEAVAGQLLDERLIACANILPAVRSLYRWKGDRGEGTEIAVLFKTRADLLDAAVARLEALHPYDAPAIVGWRCDTAGVATLGWLEVDCGSGDR